MINILIMWGMATFCDRSGMNPRNEDIRAMPFRIFGNHHTVLYRVVTPNMIVCNCQLFINIEIQLFHLDLVLLCWIVLRLTKFCSLENFCYSLAYIST
jgi:hypothetical protein